MARSLTGGNPAFCNALDCRKVERTRDPMRPQSVCIEPTTRKFGDSILPPQANSLTGSTPAISSLKPQPDVNPWRHIAIEPEDSSLPCPNCHEQPSTTSVRTTGKCDSCGELIVELPSLTAATLLDRDAFVANRAVVAKGTERWVLGPALTVFGGGLIWSFVTGDYDVLNVVLPITVALFFGGATAVHMTKAGRENPTCPTCDAKLLSAPHARAWLTATCRCFSCGHPALTAARPRKAQHLLNPGKLRELAEKHSNAVVRAAIVALASFLVFILVAMVSSYSYGLSGDDASSLAMLVTSPGFTTAALITARSAYTNRIGCCQLCEKEINYSMSVVATTGRCPHCGGTICES